MAVKSAFSCVLSFFRPFAAQPLAAENSSSNPASPRTPICDDGRAAAVQQQHVHVYASSPPVSPFIAPVAKEKYLRIIDPAAYLIERLDEGWFEDNVIGIKWWDICSLSWGSGRPEGQPSTSDLMSWVPGNLSDSELLLGSSSGMGTPESASSRSSSQLHLFAAIEMVQPLASSASGNSSADRDPRGFPGSRLRRLPRVFPDDEISLSDGEQSSYPRYLRAQSEDLPEALRRFSERQLEPSPKAKASLRRRKEKHVAEVVVPSRRFSDGEESGEGTSGPLRAVSEGVVPQVLPNSPSRTSKSHSSSRKMRSSSTEMGRSDGRLEGNELSQKERKRHHQHPKGSVAMPAPPTRWRRRDRRKGSKSMTEVGYDELRGLTDLGFNFTQDEHVGGALPGPRFYSKDGDEWLQQQSSNKSSPRSRIRSPSGGWPRHSDSPLTNWRIPSAHDSNVDMKALMKFWAHSVASTVSAEC